MLIWMRDSAAAGVFKFVLMGLLLTAVAGLVLMDVGGFFKSGSLSANTLARGGDVTISPQEFDRIARRVLSQQGIGAEEALKLGLLQSIAQSEISARLFSEEAQKMGLSVSDEAVKTQIAKLAEPLAAEGRSKKEALQQILRQQGISEGEFVSNVRSEMANGLLRSAIIPPATLAPPLLASELYRYDRETRSADIVFLKNNAMTDTVPPKDEQIRAYYEANKVDFLVPESRRITIATLKPDMLRKSVKIGEDRLKTEYDKNIASFTKPSRRKVEQIVLKTEEEAKKALEDLKAGQDVQGSDTQEYEESGLLPEIATPVFAAEKGAVIGPVKTSLGWHVLKVQDILPEQVAPLEEVKDKLREELVNIALTEEMYNTGNTIEDRIAAGDTLETIVSEYGMTTESVGPFRRNGNNGEGKDLFQSYAADKEKIVQAAFDYNKGEVAPVVETSDGQFHLIRVEQVTPDSYKPFDSVKADLEKRWMDEQRHLANKDASKIFLEKLNSGKSLSELIAGKNLEIKHYSGINRKDAPPAPLTPVVAAQIFSGEKGKAFSAEVEGGYVVGVVTDMSLPNAPEKGAKELTELSDLVAHTFPQEILEQYGTALTRDKNIQVNQSILQQMYGGR
jgi:peptidyl-prolyl cis-trans isomerase D